MSRTETPKGVTKTSPRVEVRALGGSWRLFVGDHCIAMWPSQGALEDPKGYAEETARVLRLALDAQRGQPATVVCPDCEVRLDRANEERREKIRVVEADVPTDSFAPVNADGTVAAFRGSK